MAIGAGERLALGVLSPPPKSRYPFLGRAARFLRENAKLTQDEVAYKSGLHSTYISNLEKGKENPTFKTLKSLAIGLGVTCSDILTLEEVFAKGRRGDR